MFTFGRRCGRIAAAYDQYVARWLFVIGLVTSVLGCNASPTNPTAPTGPLPIRTVYWTGVSGILSSARDVVGNADEWDRLWQIIVRGPRQDIPRPDRPLPVVDFSREMLIIAARGQHSTGGYGIEVEAVTETERAVVVQVGTSNPGRCGVTLAFTQPVHVVAVPRSERPVVFTERPYIPERCQ